MEGNATGQPESWRSLTSYLANITDSGKETFYPFLVESLIQMCFWIKHVGIFLPSGQSVTMTPGLSLDALLDGVDREKYYRYHGSLTTPTCNEVVIWTVFKDPIKVSKDLVSFCFNGQHKCSQQCFTQLTGSISCLQIDLFSTTVYFINSTSSPLMTNVFRDTQPGLPVSTQASSSSSTVSNCLGLMALCLALGKS